MIEAGDGSFAKRLNEGRCPKCETSLPSKTTKNVQCGSCKIIISVNPCTFSNWLGKCRDGMVREPDGEGCVQWTTCWSCRGRGWT